MGWVGSFGSLLKLKVESDSLELIHYLNKEDEDVTEIKSLVEAIIELTPSLGVLSFKHDPKIQNGVHFAP